MCHLPKIKSSTQRAKQKARTISRLGIFSMSHFQGHTASSVDVMINLSLRPRSPRTHVIRSIAHSTHAAAHIGQIHRSGAYCRPGKTPEARHRGRQAFLFHHFVGTAWRKSSQIQPKATSFPSPLSSQAKQN